MIQSNLPVRLRQRNNREFFQQDSSIGSQLELRAQSSGGRCECSRTPTLLRVKNMHRHVIEYTHAVYTYGHASADVCMYRTSLPTLTHTVSTRKTRSGREGRVFVERSRTQQAKCQSISHLCLLLLSFPLMASAIQ